VNTLFLATFTMDGASLDGRSPGSAADHGKQEYDRAVLRATTRPSIQSFTRTRSLKATRGDRFGRLRRAAGGFAGGTEAGHQTICWFEDVFRKDLPNIDSCKRRSCPGKTRPHCALTIRTTGIFFLGIVMTGLTLMRSMGDVGFRAARSVCQCAGRECGGRNTNPHNVTCFCHIASQGEARHQPGAGRQGFLELAKFVDRAVRGRGR